VSFWPERGASPSERLRRAAQRFIYPAAVARPFWPLPGTLLGGRVGL